MKRLRCFIAMAFDRSDTDLVYDRVIAPVIGKVALPIRIDKLEHNDDINNKIISELLDCDFAVADLTYARPSVYFEAGFAQSRVPVIYTSRADHLHPRLDDPNGNLRVHFDLQMKNIIRWRDPNDRTFRQRLISRVNRTIGPLLRQQALDAKARQSEQVFDSLSAMAKNERVKEGAISELKRAGFRPPKKETLYGTTTWLGIKRSGSTLNIAEVHIPDRHGKLDLRSQIEWRYASHINEVGSLRDGAASVREAVFVLAVAPIPRSRASAAFNWFSYNQESNMFHRDTFYRLGSLSDGRLPGTVSVHLISGIKSEPALRTELRKNLTLICSSTQCV